MALRRPRRTIRATMTLRRSRRTIRATMTLRRPRRTIRATPPLLSAGETTAGTTLPSFSVPPIVGRKAREQRVSDVTAKVDAGRLQKRGGKQVSWSRHEHLKLMQAVDRHGRDWVSVSRDVGSKTRQQCKDKVKAEVAAGRMQEPGGKQVQKSWSQAEVVQLKAAVDRHGRDWASVSRDVGSKTNKQCISKVQTEVAAGRMEEPGWQARARVMEPGRADPTQGSG
jgi:hypothetical protein